MAEPQPAHAIDWNRRVWRLAGPLIVSNLSIPMLGAVDTAVVGHLPGPEYIGAVSVGAVIFTTFYAGTTFLRMATVGLSSQAFGRGDGDEFRAVLLRAVLLGAALGLLFIVLQVPLRTVVFSLIGASADVEPLARHYFDIRIWAAPAALINIAVIGWLIGAQNTRASMMLYLLMNILNVVLDLWFVIGLDLGVGGVAWATVIAQYVTLLLGILMCLRTLKVVEGAWRRERLLDKTAFRHLLSINRDIFLRSICLNGAMFMFTALGARLGDVVLAANAILMVFQHVMSAGIDGFSHSSSSLVGEAVGAKSREHLKAAVRTTNFWAFCFAAGYSVLFALTGAFFIDLITSVPDVRAATREYLPWMVITPLISVASYQLDGFFVGATRSADMRNAMFQSVLIYIGALILCVPFLGNHGLWLAFSVLMVARGITLYRRFPKIERQIEG
ncbi:MAG: MATE family efflux transporter [Rhodospirillales bacterium]